MYYLENDDNYEFKNKRLKYVALQMYCAGILQQTITSRVERTVKTKLL